MLRTTDEGARCVLGGAIAGLAGGVAIAVVTLVNATLGGLDVWSVMKEAALPIFGDRVLEPGFDVLPIAIGITTHLTLSVMWGIAFAVLAYGLPLSATLAAALAWSLVVWFVMSEVVLQVVSGDAASPVPVNMAIFAHVVFGLAMGIGFLPWQAPHVRPTGALYE